MVVPFLVHHLAADLSHDRDVITRGTYRVAGYPQPLIRIHPVAAALREDG